MHPVRTLVRKYHWIAVVIGILGNCCFVAGSVLFLLEQKTTGIYVFIFASSAMLIGRLGHAFAQYEWRLRGVGHEDDFKATHTGR